MTQLTLFDTTPIQPTATLPLARISPTNPRLPLTVHVTVTSYRLPIS